MCLLRKDYELTCLMVEYDRWIIKEGVLSWKELKLHQERMKQLEITISELRKEVEWLLRTTNH